MDFEYYKTKIPDKSFVDKLEKFVSWSSYAFQ